MHRLLLITGSAGRIGGKQKSMGVAVLRVGRKGGQGRDKHWSCPNSCRLSDPQLAASGRCSGSLGPGRTWARAQLPPWEPKQHRFVALLIPLCTSPCLSGAGEKSLCRGRYAFLLKQMLLYWTPDVAINFGLFFTICLSQSCFSSGCKLSPCDFR